MTLYRKQTHHDADGNRHDEFFKGRCDDLQAFHSRKHRHGRGNNRITIKHGGAEHAQRHHPPVFARPFAKAALRKSGQCQNSAFTLVVGAHHEGQILHRDQRHHRPEHHGQDPEHRRLRERNPVAGMKRFLQRIKRAGTDVAEHHTDSADGQRAEFFMGIVHG